MNPNAEPPNPSPQQITTHSLPHTLRYNASSQPSPNPPPPLTTANNTTYRKVFGYVGIPPYVKHSDFPTTTYCYCAQPYDSIIESVSNGLNPSIIYAGRGLPLHDRVLQRGHEYHAHHNRQLHHPFHLIPLSHQRQPHQPRPEVSLRPLLRTRHA